MPKGVFTQGLVVLFERSPSLDELATSLAAFDVAKRFEAKAEQSWIGGNAGVVVPYRREVNGLVVVEVLDQVWPDHMGGKDEPMLFAAWSMGHLGPHAFPYSLRRAVQHAQDKQAGQLQARHRAFVRILCSYVFGAGDDAPIAPKDYAPLPELQFVTRVARAVVSLPSALAYFNPGGEVLLRAAELGETLTYHQKLGLRPLAAWSNVRVFELEDAPPWRVMDCAGMNQLDVPDHEACFERPRYDASEVANFLRNAAAYILDKGPVIKAGDTMNGPGGVNWKAVAPEKPVSDPPRDVLRWLPLDGSKPPRELVGDKERPAGVLGRLKGLFRRA